MNQPRFEILTPPEVTAAIDCQMDRLYRTAFGIDLEEYAPMPDESTAKGNSSFDWFVLGWMDSELVTQLALLRREIVVGGEKIWVVGVAGVASDPARRHQGLASGLLRATQEFMASEIEIPFGLLVCKDELRPLYEETGWKHVADELISEYEGRREVMKTSVMVYSISRPDWPAGDIDLCGSSW